MAIALNKFLLTGAALSAIAASLHIAIIIFGAPWYRFFGAGEEMATRAASGHWSPLAITSGIAVVLAIWVLYALSGAGAIRRLPFVKPILFFITAVYLLRGLVIVPMLLFAPEQTTPFWYWSSAICFTYGVVHLVGLVQVWSRLEAPVSKPA